MKIEIVENFILAKYIYISQKIFMHASTTMYKYIFLCFLFFFCKKKNNNAIIGILYQPQCSKVCRLEMLTFASYIALDNIFHVSISYSFSILSTYKLPEVFKIMENDQTKGLLKLL